MNVDVDDGAADSVRILLVDDEPDLAEVTALHLSDRRAAFDTTVVTDGRAALGVVEDDHVDCVVSDYEMPGMDGLELLRAVMDRDLDLPFILYTGRGSEEIASEAISAGVTDYLQKRTTSDQYDVLANRVENAVARRRSERARAESEGRYRTLVEASPHAILVHYGEDVVYVNDTTVRLFGFGDQSEIHDTEAMSYVHPDDRDVIRQRMRFVLDDREESDWSGWRLLRNDGEIRHVESRGTPVEYDGRPAVQVVIRDLTDQRRRERQLAALDGALDSFSTADTPTTVAETAADAVRAMLDDPRVCVFEAVEGDLFELAAAGPDGGSLPTGVRGLPDDCLEAACYREGRPRFVADYAARPDALTDAVGAVFLFPLADHGLLWVEVTDAAALDDTDRDALSVLGRSAVAALDRLGT